VAAGAIRPVVETTMPLEDVARAHQLMADGSHAGKILLTL
jgi:NADPH:quinone reductase-like Zn-dependent oxidoreductase